MTPERICVAESDTIAALLEDWARSVRDHDINGVLRHHDPDLLAFDVVGPTSFNGLARDRNTWEEQFFPWHGGTGCFELEALDVRAGDRVAFATAFLKCAGTENGQPAAFTLRLTVGLEKKDGAWSIVHEHHSEPLPFVRGTTALTDPHGVSPGVLTAPGDVNGETRE